MDLISTTNIPNRELSLIFIPGCTCRERGCDRFV